MTTLVWQEPMWYGSPGDERAFFTWLQSIPGVLSIRGEGRELHIRLRSKRLSTSSLREFIALYTRYQGRLSELAQFATPSNESWFKSKEAHWYRGVFAQ